MDKLKDMKPTECEDLLRAFEIRPGEVISLVGAGGKTALMFALAKELVARGNPVVTTTTTKIMEPSPVQSPLALVNENEDRLMGLLFGQLVDHKCVTVAAGRLTSGKLRGVSPDFIPRLAAKCAHLTIIVEADGAAGRSLKAPNSTEPVVPKNTSLVIPVVGLDALGTEMTEANVFRAQLASGLLRKILGSRVTAEDIANLVTCDNGIARTSPVYARVTPMINKADSKRALMKAEGIAENILAANHRQIGRVVLGRLRSPNRTWVVGQ